MCARMIAFSFFLSRRISSCSLAVSCMVQTHVRLYPYCVLLGIKNPLAGARAVPGCLCTGHAKPLPATMRVILPNQGIQVVEKPLGTVAALLQDLGINPLEVMVARNGTLVPEQAALCGTDEIRIIRIAHGG